MGLKFTTKKFQQSSSLRSKPFTVDVMIINGNGQQILVCNLLILNTKNVAWLNWHVARHLTKKNWNLTQKNVQPHPKIFGRVGNSVSMFACTLDYEGLLRVWAVQMVLERKSNTDEQDRA